MYTITFYSFKGGVGRTMALVNVAAQLAKMGRKVLVVDFDLEAPGLETFERLRPPEPCPGLVEYITEYMRGKCSPDVSKYIYSAGTVGEKNGQLWVMPAGRRDRDYLLALYRLDWRKLYEQCDGFVFFEDLKAQWEQLEFKPDYVLIDSRTGDTDVKGICTRQLPDAVVMLFFPNEQNLAGLKGVCREIRRERTEGLRKNIRLHFVMSNVPDLDDEDDVLRHRLEAFHKELEIGELDTVIHRYESVKLFNQAIFVLDGEKSRLASEYRQLTEKLITVNPADREGALRFLRQFAQGCLPAVAQDVGTEVSRKLGVVEEPENALSRFDRDFHPTPEAELDQLNRIAENFLDDAEIFQRIAECLLLESDFHKAITFLNRALDKNDDLAQALFDRAACHHRLGNKADAAADLLKYCRLEGLNGRAVVSALRQLSVIAPEKVPQAVELSAVRGLPRGEMLDVAEILAERDEGLPHAVQIVRKHGTGTEDGRNRLFRYLMRLRQWREAIQLLGEPPTDLFDLAMALWGETGELSEELCRNAIQREDQEYGHSEGYDPDSVPRCLMLWRLGQLAEATQTLDRVVEKFKPYPFHTVSYWTFRCVPPEQYLADCQQFRRMIQGEPIRPAFLG